MYLLFKALIYTTVILGYTKITNNSEISLFLDFALIYILISIISLVMRKIEKIIKNKRNKALS